MLAILPLIVITIAIYEIVARVRDCGWVSPDFTVHRGRQGGGLTLADPPSPFRFRPPVV
jgi:hypothetical protein